MTASDPTRSEQARPTEPRAVLGDPLERDPEIRRVLAGLQACVPASAPEPSVELLAALAAVRAAAAGDSSASDSSASGSSGSGSSGLVRLGDRPRRAARRPGYRRTVLAGALTVAVALPATGVAAANDRLPRPAERVVSRMVNDLTPFTIDPATDLPTPTHPVRAPIPRPSTAGPARPGPAVGGSGGSIRTSPANSPSAGGSADPEDTSIAVRPPASSPRSGSGSEPEDGPRTASPPPDPQPGPSESSSTGSHGD
jgi:hypothetical protein